MAVFTCMVLKEFPWGTPQELFALAGTVQGQREGGTGKWALPGRGWFSGVRGWADEPLAWFAPVLGVTKDLAAGGLRRFMSLWKVSLHSGRLRRSVRHFVRVPGKPTREVRARAVPEVAEDSQAGDARLMEDLVMGTNSIAVIS